LSVSDESIVNFPSLFVKKTVIKCRV